MWRATKSLRAGAIAFGCGITSLAYLTACLISIADPPARSAPCDGGSCDGAAGSGFCASRTDSFCADFDESDLLAGWTSENAISGALSSSDAGFISAPFSAQATETRAGGKTPPTAFLSKSFTRVSGSLHLELQMQPMQSLAFEYAQVTLGNYMITAGDEPDGLHFFEEDELLGDGGDSRKLHTFTASFAPGAWHHVVIDVAVVGSRKVNVTVDDNAVLVDEPLMLSSDPSTSGTLHLGLVYAASDGTYLTRFDDVTFDY